MGTKCIRKVQYTYELKITIESTRQKYKLQIIKKILNYLEGH